MTMNTLRKIYHAQLAYVAAVGERDAVRFEHDVLNCGRAFLPACALVVLDGGEPTAEYWTWLREQAEEMTAEHALEVQS